MTGPEVDRILHAIGKLGDQQGATREEVAKLSGRVEAKLEGVGHSLGRVDRRLDAVDLVQREHGERLARVESAREAEPTGRQSVANTPAPPADPQRRPWSMPPSVRRERIRTAGKVAAVVVTTAGTILLAYLGLAH